MAKPYSDDLRDRVARSILGGRSSRETARLFRVSVASAVKWSQRLYATRSESTKPICGHRRRMLAAEQAWIIRRLKEQPDLTVRALAIEMREHVYTGVSHNTTWSLLRNADFSFKKPTRRRTGQAESSA